MDPQQRRLRTFFPRGINCFLLEASFKLGCNMRNIYLCVPYTGLRASINIETSRYLSVYILNRSLVEGCLCQKFIARIKKTYNDRVLKMRFSNKFRSRHYPGTTQYVVMRKYRLPFYRVARGQRVHLIYSLRPPRFFISQKQ